MSTPLGFFNECVDLEGGSAFTDNFGNGEPPESGYPNNYLAYDDVFSLSTSMPNATKNSRNGYQVSAEDWNGTRRPRTGMSAQFGQTPYGGPYESARDLEAGEDSATTGLDSSNTSTTPDTGESIQTTSAAGSSSGSSRGSKTHGSKKPAESPPDPPPARKRKGGRKSTRANSSVVEEEVKRNKFLERNRIAASKCRQKKKEWVSDLEDQKAGLENRHSHLQIEYNGLLGEVSGLKEELMAHANCNDSNIDQWLENEARKFVQETSEKLYSNSRGGSNNRPGRQGSISGFQDSSYNVDPMLRNGTGSSDANGGNDASAFVRGSGVTTTSQESSVPVSAMQTSPTSMAFNRNGDREASYGQIPTGMYEEDHQRLGRG